MPYLVIYIDSEDNVMFGGQYFGLTKAREARDDLRRKKMTAFIVKVTE